MKHTLYLRDDTVKVVVNVDYRAVYRPAQISGSPEHCYPDESELRLMGYDVVEVNDLTDEGDAKSPTDKEVEIAFERDEERIITACWEDFHRGN